jgi:hypothetical protein
MILPVLWRHPFLLTTLSWVIVCLFSALPFMFSVVDLSATDSYFEAMSGLTTTGSPDPAIVRIRNMQANRIVSPTMSVRCSLVRKPGPSDHVEPGEDEGSGLIPTDPTPSWRKKLSYLPLPCRKTN